MTDDPDEAPPPAGFPWGLTPGGGGEPASPTPDARPPTTPESPPPAPAAPPPDLDVATQAMPTYVPPTAEPPAAEPFTEAYPAPLDPSLDGVGDVLAPRHVGHEDPVDEGLETSAIESLFGDAAFVEYVEEPLIPIPTRSPGAPTHPGAELVAVSVAPPLRTPITRLQRNLMWVAGGLVAALALLALFLLGTRISQQSPAPVVVASPSPSPSGVPLVGPVAPGEYAWNALLGGECLEPFESAWQNTYVVVECTEPHAAQLVDRGVLDDAVATPYPGVEALQARVLPLCTAPTVIDYAAAAAMVDIEASVSFPPDVASWDAGGRDYFCFVRRTGAEPFTGSIAVPQDAPAP